MNRIENKFKLLAANNKKALVSYITAGDPDIETTKQLVLEMDKQGADLIELGIPYSDPVADGPVIQRAGQRALSKDIKISEIMSMVGEIRKETNVPLLYLLYFNCIFQYGLEKFLRDCQLCGIDGLIIPDLPYEEAEEIKELAEEYDIYIISLITPTSDGRIKKIAEQSKGFIYCVSSTGVTGMRSAFASDLSQFMNEIKKYTNVPRAIGFGISSPEHIKELKEHCEAVIVGSAIVKIIEEYNSSPEVITKVGEFIRQLKQVL